MMKTIQTKVLIVVFMLGSFVNYANNDLDFNKIINAKKVKVAFKNVKKGHQLTLKNEKGVKLHSETVSITGLLTKVFDLSSLKNGIYTIELNKDYEIIVKTLEVKNNKIIFNEASKKVILKPVIRNKENILMISKANFHKKSMKIALYFDDEIIYSETLENEEIFNRVYKLDEEIKGEYRAVLSINSRSYFYNFKL
jgi:hypothetical protein